MRGCEKQRTSSPPSTLPYLSAGTGGHGVPDVRDRVVTGAWAIILPTPHLRRPCLSRPRPGARPPSEPSCSQCPSFVWLIFLIFGKKSTRERELLVASLGCFDAASGSAPCTTKDQNPHPIRTRRRHEHRDVGARATRENICGGERFVHQPEAAHGGEWEDPTLRRWNLSSTRCTRATAGSNGPPSPHERTYPERCGTNPPQAFAGRSSAANVGLSRSLLRWASPDKEQNVGRGVCARLRNTCVIFAAFADAHINGPH